MSNKYNNTTSDTLCLYILDYIEMQSFGSSGFSLLICVVYFAILLGAFLFLEFIKRNAICLELEKHEIISMM